MEEEFKESENLVKELYRDLRKAADMNEDLYVMPTALYNQIMKKLGHMEDRIKLQTNSLKNHLS